MKTINTKTSINCLVGFCLIFVVLFFIAGCTGNIATSNDKEIKDTNEIKETNEKESEKHLCTSESRRAEVCMALYDPVCGWFSENRPCVRYPCAVTASNSCEVCKNSNVEYWTQGECPE